MLKYRVLSQEELLALETEFKQFLILNDLHDAEWRQLASNNPEKAQGFIDLFSNIVLEKAYQKVPGLLQIGKDYLCVFHLENETWKLYQFTTKDQALLKDVHIDNFIDVLLRYTAAFEMYIGSKESSSQKATTVHELICKGAVILQREILQDFLQHFASIK